RRRADDALAALDHALALEVVQHRFAARAQQLARREELPVEEIDLELERLGNPRRVDALERSPGHDARDDEEVDDGVAVEIERGALLLFEEDDFAAVVEAGAQQLALLEERDRVTEVRQVVLEGPGQPYALESQQGHRLVDAGHELVAQHARPLAAEQHQRRDRRRIGHRRETDALDERMGDAHDEGTLARLELGAHLGLVDLSAHQRLERPPIPAERVRQRDRLAEAHVDGAEAALEGFAGAQQADHALVGLLAPAQLVDHARLLDESLVVDRDRHEEEVPASALEEGIDVPGKHAEPRRQQPAGPRAPALDEELLRQPLTDEV